MPVCADLTARCPWPQIGVAFDEPVGKHSGTVKGKSYFECGEGHGTFARGRNVKTGDYPEVDPLADDDDGTDDEL